MSDILRLALSLFIVSLVGVGIYDYVKLHEENACEMTWMYEYPEYLKVDIGKKVSEAYPKYNLYLYGEGVYAGRIRNLKLDGVPVLFIPGNAGSYRQVRSLGSVSLRKSENIKNKIQFNYFSIDFNEEFSGLYGGVLKDQTEFVHECIKRILSFYKSSKTPPSSVILVGHSMGGIIARALFTIPEFNTNHVNTIITQSTPHQSPVTHIEKKLIDFYDTVNNYWVENSEGSLHDVTVVSTGGGYRDILVRNGLTSLDNVVRPDRHIATCTMSVPRAFVSTDHLCAVWCKQIVLVTTRALFDIIDPNTKQVMGDADERLRIFKHNFITNPGTSYAASKPREITLDDKVPWEEVTDTFWKFAQPKVTSTRYIAVALEEDSVNTLLVLANVTHTNWICTCSVNVGEKRCKTCKSVSEKVRLLPAKNYNRRILRTSFDDLDDKASHVVIIIEPAKHRVDITVELYDTINRHLVYNLPGFYDTMISYPIAVMDASAMLKIANKTVYYSLHLSGLHTPLTAYIADIKPRKCLLTHKGDEGSVFSLNVPWSEETVYSYTGFNEKGSLDVKLQSGRPESFNGGAVHLEMYLNPSCFYQLRLRLSPVDSLGQIIRFYGVLFPASFIAVILISVGYLLTEVAESKEVSRPQDIIWKSCKPYLVLPIISVIRYVLSIPKIMNLMLQYGIPLEDSHSLLDQAIWSPFLPIILYLIAFGTSYLHTSLVYYIFQLTATVTAKLFSWLPNSVLVLGFVLEIAIGAGGVLVSSLYCGVTGLIVIYILIIVNVLRSFDIYKTSNKKEDEKYLNSLFFLLLLILWNIVLNLPFMVVWFKNLSYSVSLGYDPSRIPCCVLSLASLLYILIQPKNSLYSTMYGWLYYIVAIVIMLYCLQSVFLIPLISATVSSGTGNFVLFGVTFYLSSVFVALYCFTSVYRLPFVSASVVTTFVIFSLVSEFITRRRLKLSVKVQKNSEHSLKVDSIDDNTSENLENNSEIEMLISRISNLSLSDEDISESFNNSMNL